MKITLFFLGLAVVIGLAVAVIVKRPAAQATARSNPSRVVAPDVTPLPPSGPSPAEPARTISGSAPATLTVPPAAAPEVAPQSSPARKPKEPLHDPDARVALSLVGANPVAEQYWLAAICDPNLPDQEREDLMEDLNEEGLSDPKHPGPEDVPLILNRLAIIEEIAPQADEFMMPHLWEAYKDLNDLVAGKPVR